MSAWENGFFQTNGKLLKNVNVMIGMLQARGVENEKRNCLMHSIPLGHARCHHKYFYHYLKAKAGGKWR